MGLVRRLKSVVRRKPKPTSNNNNNAVVEETKVVKEEKKDKYLSKTKDGKPLSPQRKITSLTWTGPVLKIKGYFYLDNIAMTDEDMVTKSLVIVNKDKEKMEVPLRNIKVTELGGTIEQSSKYVWSGFEGTVNFSVITNGKEPLLASEYDLFLKIRVRVSDEERYKKVHGLGNIEHFLQDGFYATKMEYFTAKRELKYNLLADYNLDKKTLHLSSIKLKDMDPSELNQEGAVRPQGRIAKKLQSIRFKIAYRLFCFLPLDKKKITFASDSREDMSGNFQFVYEELLNRNENFQYRFMLKKSISDRKTSMELLKLAYHFATSKFIILDDFYPIIYGLKIRKNAELVQLWHAVGAFKTFGFSRIGLPGGPSPKSVNHRNYTKAIVSSQHVVKHYAEGFGIAKENVIPTGVPRTDVFFDEDYKKNVRENLYEEYPFLRDKKVIMFAPTFRGNGQSSAHYPSEYLDFKKLYDSLKDEYVFILKVHPFIKNDFEPSYEFSDFFYDFSAYREINDLLFITDILITDYSSVCFEYALLNKPMIFFAPDVEKYVRSRDFYYNYHSFIPGTLAKDTNQLVDVIINEDFKTEKIEPFVNYFFDDLDGKSSARVVDQIILGEIGLEDLK